MWKRLLLLLFAALALSACGSKGKTYRVGVDANWYPLNLMGKEASVYAFTDELLRAISREEDVFFDRINVSWDNLILGLKEDHYDGMLSSITPRIYMQSVYEFSEPFLHTGPVLVVRSDIKMNSLGDMRGKEVAVNSLQTETLLIEIYPGVIAHYYDTIPEGLNEVIFNNIDAILVDYLLASSYIRNLYNGKVKIASPPLNDSGLRLLTLHGENKDLVQVFNRGLSKLQDNGTFDKLLKKWELN